jgi:polyhydroxyalkanoate synthesis repressor PhaR
MQERRIIKRYQNRKLYDTQQSCYVTLEEIAQMIRGGDDLVVIDNKSKNDITHSTLTQLLFENEKKSKSPAPVSLLKEVVRTGDGSLSGYILSRMGPAEAGGTQASAASAEGTDANQAEAVASSPTPSI